MGYSPNQIARTYGLNSSDSGKGETIAIIDAFGSPTIANDISVFDNQFAISKIHLKVIYLDSLRINEINRAWGLETSSDVEWAHAIATKANILLIVANSSSRQSLLNAIDYATSHGANVISCSWHFKEFRTETQFDTHFNHNGIVYISTVGDRTLNAVWPASSPYVMSIGGTTLILKKNGAYKTEYNWIGSGGGKSKFESRPVYQNIIKSLVGNNRGIPDVSWDANPETGFAVYDSSFASGSKWIEDGGTSIGAPCWAGIVAIIDQRSNVHLSSKQLLTDLYNIYSSKKKYRLLFHAIRFNINTNNTLSGYNFSTGLGTPKLKLLIPFLTSKTTH